MSRMTRAGVLWGAKEQWQIAELELDEPKANEVLVRFEVAGLCHSDDHFRAGDIPSRFPLVGGHEGAGVVEQVGPGVTRVQVGDHIVCSFLPVCGTCRWCSTGHQGLCDLGLNAGTGLLPDGTYRFHGDGHDIGGVCVLGTFSERAVLSEYSCVKIDADLPFDVAALLGCGVPTGWGASVYGAGVEAGQVVVIYGSGGVGANAVQGAAQAGARIVAVVDPIGFKREKAMELGATHAFASHDEAFAFVRDTTRGQLADHAIITVGVNSVETVNQAASVIGKLGSVVIVATGNVSENQLVMPAQTLKGYQQAIKGVMFGNCNPLYDIPRLISQYREGSLRLDELITRRYRLDQLNEGFDDLLAGRNIRGIIEYS